jgi:hypothetical protein
MLWVAWRFNECYIQVDKYFIFLYITAIWYDYIQSKRIQVVAH